MQCGSPLGEACPGWRPGPLCPGWGAWCHAGCEMTRSSSVFSSRGLSLLLPTLLYAWGSAGVSRAGLCLRCCCVREWLVSRWFRVTLTGGMLGSTSCRVFPILTGPLEGKQTNKQMFHGVWERIKPTHYTYFQVRNSQCVAISWKAHFRNQCMRNRIDVLPFISFPMCNCQSRMKNTNTISRHILWIKEHFYQNTHHY